MNDTNGEIVNLFHVLRDAKLSEELLRLLRLTPFARDELNRARSNEISIAPVERARRLIVRSQFGRGSCLSDENTGFRSKRKNSVSPAGDWNNYPDALAKIIECLRGVTIENLPAVKILERYDGSDVLFYVDPPYPHHVRRHKNDYADGEMSDEEHRVLAHQLHILSGMVVLSGYRCQLMDELYFDWMKVERRSYNDGANVRTECLWLSPNVVKKLENHNT